VLGELPRTKPTSGAPSGPTRHVIGSLRSSSFAPAFGGELAPVPDSTE
jgi:hypothetical protein